MVSGERDNEHTRSVTKERVVDTSERRLYSSPTLHSHGDLRGLTCGASGPDPESGGGFFSLLG